MNRHLKKSILTPLIFLLVIGLLIILQGLVNAQSMGRVLIYPLDTKNFPTVSFLMEAYSPDQNFLIPLEIDETLILENDNKITPESIEILQPGVQIILTINEAPFLSNRTNAESHFERIMAHLLDWVKNQPETTSDDLSLATNTGLKAIRLSKPKDWVNALESYEINLAESQASLISFSQALELASDPMPNPLKKQAILYVTPLPNAADLDALNNLTGQAFQLSIKLFVWVVAPAAAVNSAEIQPLVQMAEDTSGGFFLFSGREDFPDLESYFQSMRYLYEIVYRSKIIESGSNQVEVLINSPLLQSSSNPQDLDLTISAPNVILLTPPTTIRRSLVKSSVNKSEQLTPINTTLNLLMEFPDGMKRKIIRSSLFVDDVLIVENTSEPFERFIWNIDSYQETSEHLVRVEVEDELGLVGSTIDSPVTISVETHQPGLLSVRFSPRRIIIGGLLSLTFIALLTGYILSLKQPHGIFLRDKSKKEKADKKGAKSRAMDDKSGVINGDQLGMSGNAANQFPTPARLVQVNLEGFDFKEGTIFLSSGEHLFGRESERVHHYLDNPTVDPVHAKISRQSDGIYFIKDLGSKSGTWLNYAKVSQEGASLRHADLVFIGLLAYRFELKNPDIIPRVMIKPYNQGDDDQVR